MRPTVAPWTQRSRSFQTHGYFVDVPETERSSSSQRIGCEESWDSTRHVYELPKKWIRTEEDLKAFVRSPTARDFLSFLASLSRSVEGKKVGEESHASETIKKLDGVLHRLAQWVEQIPPAENRVRYGNPSYRIWHAKMSEHAREDVESFLPSTLQASAIELAEYWKDSFGNATRIDYGTGHETNFLAFLYCLARIGVVHEEDREALILLVFNNYLRLMRKVQVTYWLEPAGSHGVWGLDDYQHLPFYFGSSQLIGHRYITPRSIHNPEILEGYAQDYMYLASVAFVLHVKKGHLRETSPIISDISSIKDWGKINRGMLRMYENEVLGKLPIMQHFLFGSIITPPRSVEKSA